MFELIVIAAVMVFIVSRLDAHHFEEAKSHWGLGTAPVQIQRLMKPVELGPHLRIAGTETAPGNSFKFVKGFGLRAESLADLRVYAGLGRYDAFPESVRTLLGELHEAGCAVGTDIMEIMFHDRELAANEAVYFALVENDDETHVVAYVDRMRAA
jgi:hypothetical protein